MCRVPVSYAASQVGACVLAGVLVFLVMGDAAFRQLINAKEDELHASIIEDECYEADYGSTCIADVTWDYHHWFVPPIAISLAIVVLAWTWVLFIDRRAARQGR